MPPGELSVTNKELEINYRTLSFKRNAAWKVAFLFGESVDR